MEAQRWAQRQESAFEEWVAQYGSDDTQLWDFGLDSLDRLTYILFNYFPTQAHLDDARNAEFVDGAVWYLGEIVRRSEPKKRRWSNRHTGTTSGEYIVEHTAKSRSSEYVVPGSHLRSAIRSGNPQFLRTWYGDYIAPLWTKPWPAWIHQTNTGTWTFDDDNARWVSQRDQWRDSITGMLATLDAALPTVTLDYSPASLHQLERHLIGDPAGQDPALRTALAAYLGESLLRAAGGKWIWDDRRDRATNGFPVIDTGSVANIISPAHVLEYALAWRDGHTLPRLHRAAIARRETLQKRGRRLFRETTPGLDGPTEPSAAVIWAHGAAQRFGDWAAQYGADHTWDYSAASLHALASVLLQHCPARTHLLSGPASNDFYEGAVWYFGETLRRAKPSHWDMNPPTHLHGKALAGAAGPALAGMRVVSDVAHDTSLAVYLVQELNRVVCRTRWSPTLPAPDTDPEALVSEFNHWATSPVRGRIKESLTRRQRVRRRVWRHLSDEQFLARWISEQQQTHPGWVQRYGDAEAWDFRVDSLDALEELIWRIASEPEALLEDPINHDFLTGATWYLGETLRRTTHNLHWSYRRDDIADPVLIAGSITAEPVERLVRVYTDFQRTGGTLRTWHGTVTSALTRNA
ncbi:hypothetical protein H7J87_20745 [Mycolicibacterium wolinskyi]|uniref:Uncharacterized protein n=1 Tax=Mycolicibacterium wolinskyi TaxID=59750 RepID=A0A1X2F208_9MYCO|nr:MULTISPECIES: hypothetical protein [Mycolicibacterium]MCV7287757.1 hypothetical protein [Mycolicibacterium wolinskyi]MCV7294655.1 hypothetical protein [Mycolicibacterium goodii]ORX12474.1 hypothetical protein AWC31_31345 [Mycolicibacterium wolinskyi]